jgi:hypothetical protein
MRDLMCAWAYPLLLAADPAKAGIDKLDGPTRANVLAALAALIILGFGLVALVWMGARYTRRYMGGRPSGPSGGVRTDEWVRRSPDDEPRGPSLTQPPPD